MTEPALDAASAALVAESVAAGVQPLHEMGVAGARRFGALQRERSGPGPDMARVEEVTVPGGDGGLRLRVLTPVAATRGVIVYFHGGGWVLGAIDEFDAVARHLARRTACTVVLVDYRLAPEHPYPAAIDDAVAATAWAAGHLAQLAGPGVPLVVAGDSAGGNLAAVVAQRARRRSGAPPVDLQVLVYPVTDADFDTASYLDPANQLCLSRDTMMWFWDTYLPDPDARRDPDASPLRAADLSGVAPAVVLTAGHDVLRDDGEAYVARLRSAGVPVRHRRFADQMHAFFTMVDVLPGAAAGMDHVTAEINRYVTDGWKSE